MKSKNQSTSNNFYRKIIIIIIIFIAIIYMGKLHFTSNNSENKFSERYKSDYIEIYSNVEDYNITWTFSMMENAYLKLKDNLGYDVPNLPIKITFYQIQTNRVLGNTDKGELSVYAKDWVINHYITGFSVQELVNVYSSEVVSYGWPKDWWVNEKSPAAIMMSNEILKEINYGEFGKARDNYFMNDPLFKMFHGIFQEYGWKMFASMFKNLKNDQIDFTQLGPNPGTILTNYVVAYMHIGVKQSTFSDNTKLSDYDLTMIMQGVCPGYNETFIDIVLEARRLLKIYNDQDSNFEAWIQYRAGNAEAVIDLLPPH
mgnify:CR=1 FL=1